MSSGRNPDFAVIFRDAPKNERGRRPPDLVAEIVSRGAEERDYAAKRDEYLRFGIKEYWIVDPQLRQVTVLVRDDAGTGPIWVERVFRDGEAASSVLLPQFEIVVSELWAGVECDEGDGEE